MSMINCNICILMTSLIDSQTPLVKGAIHLEDNIAFQWEGTDMFHFLESFTSVKVQTSCQKA